MEVYVLPNTPAFFLVMNVLYFYEMYFQVNCPHFHLHRIMTRAHIYIHTYVHNYAQFVVLIDISIVTPYSFMNVSSRQEYRVSLTDRTFILS